MTELLDRIFEMDRKIWAELPDADDCEFTDAGMYVDPNGHDINTLWRDAAFQVKGEEEEVSFSYSTNGDLRGDIPPKYALGVNRVLNEYKRDLIGTEISNISSM